jgi:hypothetical protein
MVMPKDTESSKQKKEEKSPKTLVERTGIELTEDQLELTLSDRTRGGLGFSIDVFSR